MRGLPKTDFVIDRSHGRPVDWRIILAVLLFGAAVAVVAVAVLI